MNSAMVWVFCLSVAGFIYTQVGYVALLVLVSRLVRWPVHRDSIRPFVSLIVPVHNGSGTITRKIRNLRALDYPPDLLEIIVVDDCSSDSTLAKIASECTARASEREVADVRLSPPVRMVCLNDRCGKAAALNVGLRVASGDVIGFTDVAAMLDPRSLAEAVERFADPTVGCVSSEDEIDAAGGVGASEGLYTRLDTLTRRLESDIGSATGCNGSFYLARRELCPTFPLDVATDMFSALYCVSKGYRAIVEPDSKVVLAAQSSVGREFERKVRTMVTGLRALRGFAGLLNPFRTGLYAVFLASHKLVRYITPFFVAAALASSAYLALSSSVFMWLFYAEAAVLGIGVLQIVAQALTSRQGCAGVPAFFCATTAAAVAGWYRFLRGERYEKWKPTERSLV